MRFTIAKLVYIYIILESFICNGIWNGKKIKIEKAPFIVRVVSSMHWCTGTLVTAEWVITAAHCLDVNDNESYIEYGVTNLFNKNRIREYFKERYTHPKFIKGTTTGHLIANHDVALGRLTNPIIFSKVIGNLSIETIPWPYNRNSPTANRKCKVIGYGKHKYERYGLLRSSNFIAMHGNYSCSCLYSRWLVCLEYVPGDGTCIGDSGAPLICDNKLVGLQSVIFNTDACTNKNFTYAECGSKNALSLFTYLYENIEFIERYIRFEHQNMGRPRSSSQNLHTVKQALLCVAFLYFF